MSYCLNCRSVWQKRSSLWGELSTASGALSKGTFSRTFKCTLWQSHLQWQEGWVLWGFHWWRHYWVIPGPRQVIIKYFWQSQPIRASFFFTMWMFFAQCTSHFLGFLWLMWLLAYNGQTPVGWRWIMMMDISLEPFFVSLGGNRCWRHHQNCGGPHKDPLDSYTLFTGRDHLIFATNLPHFCEQAVYNVHNSSQTSRRWCKNCICNIFSTSVNFHVFLSPVNHSTQTSICSMSPIIWN